MEAELESPPHRWRKNKISRMKTRSPSEGQKQTAMQTSKSSQESQENNQVSELKDSMRRSPRIEDIKVASPVNFLPIDSKDAKVAEVAVDPNKVCVSGKDTDTSPQESPKKNFGLENDLELSSSESDAESVASSTRSKGSPRNSQNTWKNNVKRLGSPRRSTRLSEKDSCSDSSESAAVSPRGDQNVLLTRSRRLSESSNESVPSPSMDTFSRNTRSRKSSESSESSDKKVNEPESQFSKRLTRHAARDSSKEREVSKLGSSRTNSSNIGSNTSQPLASPNILPSVTKQEKDEFKEPLPISSPRGRRKSKSESVDISDQDIKPDFVDRKVTRSISCPGGVTANVGELSIKTRNLLRSPGGHSVEDVNLSEEAKNNVKSPKTQAKQNEAVTQELQYTTRTKLKDKEIDNKNEKEINKQSDSPKQEQEAETSGVILEREETSADTDKLATEKKGKRLSVSDQDESENQETGTPPRVTRSQVKTVKSPEVIRREEGLEKIRLARERKRSKGQESESDDEEPIQKKLNRSRSRIDSASESDNAQADTEMQRITTRSVAKDRRNSENSKATGERSAQKNPGDAKGNCDKFYFAVLNIEIH